MSFWSEKLAGRTPSQASAEVNAWWSSSSSPPAIPQPPEDLKPVPAAMPMQRQPTAGHCPECHSANYMPEKRNVAGRCFDCGYPVVQSTSGMSIGQGVPYGKPVRQAHNAGFNPQKIVDRVL